MGGGEVGGGRMREGGWEEEGWEKVGLKPLDVFVLWCFFLSLLVFLCHQQGTAKNAANHEPWC